MLTYKYIYVKMDIRNEGRSRENNKITERGTIGKPNMFYIQFGLGHKVI